MMQYDLESRWKLEKDYLQYYGLRNKKQLFKNKIRISLKKKQIIKKLPCELTPSELKILQSLIGTVIVPLENKKKVPSFVKQEKGRGMQKSVYLEEDVYQYIQSAVEEYNLKFSYVMNSLLRTAIQVMEEEEE